MHQQFIRHCGTDSDYRWNPETMHFFCFCHKLALVVGSGLAALSLKTPPPRKIKTAFRGRFPAVGTTLAEDDEPNDPRAGDGPPEISTSPTGEEDVSDVKHDLQELEETENLDLNLFDRSEDTLAYRDVDDEEDWDAADAEDARNPMLQLDNSVAPTHRREANTLHFILETVCLQAFGMY